MRKNWTSTSPDDSLIDELVRETGLPRPACAVLAVRGYTSADAVETYLNPRLSALTDPFLLPDMEPAVARLQRALADKETVLVYGDYDVDGITSTALMVRVLSALGATVVPFLPHRVDDGYGLGVEPVQRCIEAHKPDLIVTVDCGTGSVEAVEAARACGVDVVVTDHHEPREHMAQACAIVNPKRDGDDHPLRYLAGVGVAFKLCHALLKSLRDTGHPRAEALDLKEALDLVAVGTVADMVPLSDENRILVRYGLMALNRTTNAGLLALKEAAGIKTEMDAYHIGFLLGPRLNAAGRLGTALTALELLMTSDTGRAATVARELDAANRERQQVEARMVEEAIAEIDRWFDPDRHYSVIAAKRGWHPGVIGIVASRLCARYSRPAMVIAVDEEGVGRGSCRSIAPFNMVEGLADCAALLQRYGGHQMAAGLQIEEKHLDALRERFNAAVQARVSKDELRQEQRIDAWITLREADWTLMECLDRMAPFGLGNPKPVWGIRGARIVGEPRVVGQKHVKMAILDGNTQLEAIAFNMAERAIPDGPLDIAFQLNRNTWMNRDTLQMNIQDVRPHSEAALQ